MSAADSPLQVGVLGHGHLGRVFAAGSASAGHLVTCVAVDGTPLQRRADGPAPLFEPGLEELVSAGLESGRLRLSSDATSLPEFDVLWVAIDTPVGEDGRPDPELVLSQIRLVLPRLGSGAIVLISSQLPVGSARKVLTWATQAVPSLALQVAVLPENIRYGTAVEDFLQSGQLAVGCANDDARHVLERLLDPFAERLIWMSLESAEMSKHAINAFLATSVALANEIATLCEHHGADARDVELSMKADPRIGAKAYVRPGAAFSGGTLERDITYLNALAHDGGHDLPILEAILRSNHRHGLWVQRRLAAMVGELTGYAVAVWGLAYKPGTDCLDQSLTVDLVDWLLASKARVSVHDPKVEVLPSRWARRVHHAATPIEAVDAASILIVGSPWPEYQSASIARDLARRFEGGKLLLIDPYRALPALADVDGITYCSVGVRALSSDRPRS